MGGGRSRHVNALQDSDTPDKDCEFYVDNEEKYPHLNKMAKRKNKWAQFLVEHGEEDVPDQKFAGLLCNDVAPLWERLMASNVTVSYLSARHRSDLASAAATVPVDPSGGVSGGWTFFEKISATREIVFERQFQNPEAWYNKADEKDSDPRELAACTADAYFESDALGGFLRKAFFKDAELDLALKEESQGWWATLWARWGKKRKTIKSLKEHSSENRLALELLSTVLNRIDSRAVVRTTASLTGTMDTSFGHQLWVSLKGLATFIVTCSRQREIWTAYFVEVHWWTRGKDGSWSTTYEAPEKRAQRQRIPRKRKKPQAHPGHQEFPQPPTVAVTVNPPTEEPEDNDTGWRELRRRSR